MNPLIALYIWPAVVVVLFQKYRVALAFLLSLVAGFLLLPERTEIDFPLLPALNKDSVPVLGALIMIPFVALRMQGQRIRPGWLPKNWVARLLITGLVAGAFLTVLTNGDGLVYGTTYLPALRIYDAFSFVLSMIFVMLPMVLARKFLAYPQEHRLLLFVLCVAGLLYSLLALYEVRMSPQLNLTVYGFFPHSWGQHVRGNGYRPLVFLEHGLLLAIFLSATVLATAGLLRIEGRKSRRRYLAALAWLGMTLVLAKSLGALAITLVLVPVILILSVRMQLIIAAIIAGLVLLYPVARGANVVPLDRVLVWAENINPLRAESFATRVENEEAMLAKAQQRMVFGWGGWSRSRVFNERGQDITIADGYWIIILGVGGWVRYLSEFGLLAASIFMLALHKRRYEVGLETSVLAIILVGNLIDLLPNAGISPITWIVAGALWGRLELREGIGEVTAEEKPQVSAGARRKEQTDKPPRPTTTPRGQGPSYTREYTRKFRGGVSHDRSSTRK